MSPQQPVYTRSEWMDGSDDALGPIGDIRDAVIQLEAGEWKGGAESALSAVQGIGELALGGLGGLISYGVDILLNYVDPLKFWMDQLTGDSAQVNGMAMTWVSIGDSLRSTASELNSGSTNAMQNMKGESVSRYLGRQGQVIGSINTLADASATVGSAVAKAAELVKKTHDYVCKLISDIIGEAVEGVAFAGLTLGASIVKAAVVVGERAIAEAANVQNILNLLKMAFDELKSLFDILTAAAPAFLSAIREVGKECGTPGGGCCGEGSSSSSDKPKHSPLDEPVRECPPEEKEEKHIIDYLADPFLEPFRVAEDVVKPLVKPIGDAVKKVVEDPEGYGLTRPFTPKVHVPPSTVERQMEREQQNGSGSGFKGSSVSGSGENWGKGSSGASVSSSGENWGKDTNAVNNGWAFASGDFGSDSNETNNGWAFASGDFGSDSNGTNNGWASASGDFGSDSDETNSGFSGSSSGF